MRRVSDNRSLMNQACTMVPLSSSTIVHQGSAISRYVERMKENVKPVDIIVENLRALMRATSIKKKQLAQKSGVSERMIGYILAKEKTPTVDITDAIAKPFGLEGWQLLIPGVRADLAKAGKLSKLMQNYSIASDNGREYIDRVAEQEAKYQVIKK